MNEVYVVSAVRTAIGTFGGSLKDIPPAELASRVTAEAVRRASVAPADIGHVVFGQVVQTEPRDMYVSRVAAVDAGIPVETPALTVNRLCGSGLQAIVSAAQSIKLGDCDVAVAGGVESMSRAPFQAPSFRWGTKMGSAPIVDVLDNALRDPFHRVLMGVTAENVASGTVLPAMIRTRSPLKVIGALRRPARPAISRSKSSASRSKAARAPPFSMLTSTCGMMLPPGTSRA
jgi:acetyl-CoA C-acetyltransferase